MSTSPTFMVTRKSTNSRNSVAIKIW